MTGSMWGVDYRDTPSGRWVLQPDMSWLPDVSPLESDRVARGWVKPTLGTNVADYGTPYDGPRYFKDLTGFVHLRGGVGFTGAVGAGGTLLTLPQGFRPAFTLSYAVASSAGVVRLDVDSSGVVSVNGTGYTTGGLVSLAGVYFAAEG